MPNFVELRMCIMEVPPRAWIGSADNPLNLAPPLHETSPNRTIHLFKSVFRNFDSRVYQHQFVLLYTAYLSY